MFRNIKKLSEYSWQTARLVYDGDPNKPKETPPAGAEKPKMTLDALKLSVAEDYRKHLVDYKTEILAFLDSEAVKKYDTGEWKEWNVKLLDQMGFNVSQEVAQGIIKRLQEYLKSAGLSVEEDGMFGPNLLEAIKEYYKNLERTEG